MNTFQIFGILFLVLGGVQSLTILGFFIKPSCRKQLGLHLFLFMGALFIGCGVWMLNL